MKKVHRKRRFVHVKAEPEYNVDLLAKKSHSTFVQRMKVSGYAFVLMGFALVALSIIFSQQNKSVADYIVSIFMQFLPGAILLVAGFKTLREV